MINPPDFKSIKCSVTMESVLRHYQVQLRRSGKDQYRGCCPIHRGDGYDAFHVNSARNILLVAACEGAKVAAPRGATLPSVDGGHWPPGNHRGRTDRITISDAMRD
jgi:hypothetical protein